MIYAKPGQEFEALLSGVDTTGLIGTLGTRIDNTAGEEVEARSTTEITEPIVGNYIAKRIAPTEEGNYLFIWDRVKGGAPLDPVHVAVEQLQVTRITPFDSIVAFLPDPSDVGALLRSRTFDSSSAEVGTFTTQTRPTIGEVQTFINQAGNEVGARLGQEIEDDGLRAYARELVALRAAMAVELSYFPEQTSGEQSAFDNLEKLYETGIASLIQALPDTSSTKKGFYSLRTRSEVSGVFPTSELLP